MKVPVSQSRARAAGVSSEAVGHFERSTSGRLASGLDRFLLGAEARAICHEVLDDMRHGCKWGDRCGTCEMDGMTCSTVRPGKC